MENIHGLRANKKVIPVHACNPQNPRNVKSHAGEKALSL